MDDEIIAGKVFREISSGYNVNSEPLSYALPQHPRNLYPAYVFCGRSVCTGFGDKHTGVFSQPVQSLGPVHECGDVTFVTGEKYRK